MLKKIEDMNFYELLEVSHRATTPEIHKAYERVRRIYDPNSIALYSLFSPEETEKIRTRIEDAYRTLIYEDSRREYDRLLRSRHEIPEPDPPRPRFAYRPPSAAPSAPVAQPIVPAPPVPEQSAAAAVQQTAPAEQQAMPSPSLITEFTGSVLRALREQRGWTLSNVADFTKISSRYIQAIEDEQFQKLPARPYLRGFLVLYAKALGYDPERITGDYLKRCAASGAKQK